MGAERERKGLSLITRFLASMGLFIETGKTREGETKISLPALSNLGCLIRLPTGGVKKMGRKHPGRVTRQLTVQGHLQERKEEKKEKKRSERRDEF